MENDPVQAAIKQAADKFSAQEWSGLLPSHLRVAAIYAELRRLDAKAVAGAEAPRRRIGRATSVEHAGPIGASVATAADAAAG